MGWKVKHERPEDVTSAEEFYEKTAAQYESPGMVRTQQRLTRRAIELLGLSKGKVLDVGCGTGVSTDVLAQHFDAVGVDVSEKMVGIAKQSGLKCSVANATKLPFKESTFDGIVSVSAVQWVKGVRKMAKEFHRVLKPEGIAVMQGYFQSEQEMNRFARVFARNGFKTIIAVDNPKLARKRKVFVVAEKLKEP